MPKRKGELVERIVAMMYEGELQITVRRDVRLPAQHSSKCSRHDIQLVDRARAGPESKQSR